MKDPTKLKNKTIQRMKERFNENKEKLTGNSKE